MTHLATLFYFSLASVFLLVGPALAAIAIRRSLAIRWQIALMGLCLLYAVSPLFLMGVGSVLQETWQCSANITLYECPGSPWFGEIVTLLLFAPWGLFLTLPSAFLGLIGLLVSIILTVRRSRSNLPPSAQTAFFYRSRRRKAIAGICATLSQWWGVPLISIRIAIVVLTLVMPLLGLPLYIWCWIAFPLEPTAQPTS